MFQSHTSILYRFMLTEINMIFFFQNMWVGLIIYHIDDKTWYNYFNTSLFIIMSIP